MTVPAERHQAQPGFRASDEERRRVVAELERHTTDGRLSLGEFTDRVGRAYAALTQGELAAIVADLPPPPVAPAPPARDQRNLLIALALALVTIAALAVVLALFR